LALAWCCSNSTGLEASSRQEGLQAYTAAALLLLNMLLPLLQQRLQHLLMPVPARCIYCCEAF
jgi:hypothetical protein